MCGLHNELIQRQLLSKPELTLAKVTEIALAMDSEAVAKDTLKLQGGKESEVNKINHENERVHNVKPKPHDNL